jgi:hypothetical protein
MRLIITTNGAKYVDQAFKDYLSTIWSTFNKTIPNDKNIFFLKNTTIPKIISDYSGTNISRVIKKEKANYCIIKKFDINLYPIFYDSVNNCMTEVDTGDVMYSTNNLYPEDYQTLEQILDFFSRGQVVEYVNQDSLNDSLNNGFIIDKENYTTIKSLMDSGAPDNLQIAASMLINSDLDKNLDWILYIYHKEGNKLLFYDTKNIIKNYYSSKNINLHNLLNANLDAIINIVTVQDVLDCIVQKMRADFSKHINVNYFSSYFGTEKFVLTDFHIKLK